VTERLRLIVPLQQVAMGLSAADLDLWEALPPLGQASLWIVELHCEGYDVGATVRDLSLVSAQGRRSGCWRLLPVPTPAARLDASLPDDFLPLPRPAAECRVGQRICASTTGRIRRLHVICTNRDGALAG
jgi:hypothetical protein